MTKLNINRPPPIIHPDNYHMRVNENTSNVYYAIKKWSLVVLPLILLLFAVFNYNMNYN